MDWSFRENWDEYTWAKEIRKDEMRISGYFRALKTCLDLPGEEEMIFKRLMSQPELVPTGVSDPLRTLKYEMEQFELDPDETDPPENIRRKPFEPARRVEKLAVEWNLLAASRLDLSDNSNVLFVTCAFGKLLSRIYNFMETEDDDTALNLRISLLKNMLADLNDLSKSFSRIEKDIAGKEYVDLADRFFTPLAFVRELIITQLTELNNLQK